MGGAIGVVVYCTDKRVCQTPQKACSQALTPVYRLALVNVLPDLERIGFGGCRRSVLENAD